MELNPFEIALAKNIKKKKAENRRAGITGMSVENLMQTVSAPPSFLEGAPRGTNARWSYVEMFRRLV